MTQVEGGIMFCPGCGTESIKDVRFCRSCGADLQLIQQVFTGQLQPSASGDALVESKTRRQKLMRQGGLLAWGGFVLMWMIIILGVAMLNFDDDTGEFLLIFSAIASPIILTGLALMIYSRLLPKEPGDLLPGHLAQTGQTVKMPRLSLQEERPSVTENTTELLEEMKARDTAPQNQ